MGSLKYRMIKFIPHDRIRFFAFTNYRPEMGFDFPFFPNDVGTLTITLRLVVISLQMQIWFK